MARLGASRGLGSDPGDRVLQGQTLMIGRIKDAIRAYFAKRRFAILCVRARHSRLFPGDLTGCNEERTLRFRSRGASTSILRPRFQLAYHTAWRQSVRDIQDANRLPGIPVHPSI